MSILLKKSISIYLLFTVLLMTESAVMAQSVDDNSVSSADSKQARVLPFGANWAKNKGIDLPSPFGVSAFFTFMSRDIEITDVSVEFGGRDPESISEYSSFAVRNQTYVSAIKFDTWILPILNVYVLAGYASTNAHLNADININRPILPLPPVNMKIETATKVKGPYTGIGTTMVGGYKNWFVMGDVNYGKTWPDLLNNTVDITMLSLRSGLSGKLGETNSIKAWLGAAYIDSKSMLEIKENSDVLGEVIVRVEQHPVNSWTYQCGFLVDVGENFEFMTELGSNFEDASIFVLNVAYRF